MVRRELRNRREVATNAGEAVEALACPLKLELIYLGLLTTLQLQWSKAEILSDKDLCSAMLSAESFRVWIRPVDCSGDHLDPI